MKIYKHDLYTDIIVLARPMFDKIVAVPYCFNSLYNRWERAGLGTALYFYPQEKLDSMECLGDTDTNWEYVGNNDIDSSYLIDKRGK